MMIAITLVLLSWAVLFLLVFTYRRDWLRERDARLSIHRARILDNDQRSVDNERWAERVQQARQIGQDQVDVLERRRFAGAPGEGAAEHIRNVLGILINAPSLGHENSDYNLRGWVVWSDPDDRDETIDWPLVVLEQGDVVAVKSRLWSAVNMLEGRHADER